MDRFYSANVSGTAPTPPAAGAVGYPRPGNPGTGAPATKPGPYWFHMVTEEIRKVITDAGMVPDHLNVAQLSQAIQALGGSLAKVHGQCRLAKAGANLTLLPLNGNRILINGSVQTVSSGGVSLSAVGLTPGTLYYIYAYMNAGVVTLEASATGHSADPNTGVEIKTGDVTRTLVGMSRLVAGPAWQDTASQRFVRSWFNDPGIQGINGLAVDRSTASGTVVEISASATERVEFLAWANERAKFEASGSCTNTSGGNNGVLTSIGIDAISVNANAFTWAGAGSGLSAGQYVFEPAACSVTASLTEGYHYATLVGYAYSGGTSVWRSGSGINVFVG